MGIKALLNDETKVQKSYDSLIACKHKDDNNDNENNINADLLVIRRILSALKVHLSENTRVKDFKS